MLVIVVAHFLEHRILCAIYILALSYANTCSWPISWNDCNPLYLQLCDLRVIHHQLCDHHSKHLLSGLPLFLLPCSFISITLFPTHCSSNHTPISLHTPFLELCEIPSTFVVPLAIYFPICLLISICTFALNITRGLRILQAQHLHYNADYQCTHYYLNHVSPTHTINMPTFCAANKQLVMPI